jgi:predicted enzyme related to lactoylglutathione lyase
MKYRRIFLAACASTLLSTAGAQSQQASATSEAALPTVKALVMMAATIPSSDLERSIAFYTKGLGMTMAGRVEMGSITEVPLMFPGGGAYLMLQHPKAEGTALPSRGALNRIVLNVPDLKALEAQLKAAGFKLEGQINEMKQYKVAVAHVVDPDGNHLELVQRT